jgi:hypothetical protein
VYNLDEIEIFVSVGGVDDVIAIKELDLDTATVKELLNDSKVYEV